MGFKKTRSKKKRLKKNFSRKKRGGQLPEGCKKKASNAICNYCKGINYSDPKCRCCPESPESLAALNKAKSDSETVKEGKTNLNLWATQAPCKAITPQEIKKWNDWTKENNLSPELVEPLKQRYRGCIKEAKKELSKMKRPSRRAPMSPDNPRFCEYCKEVNFNDPYCKKCKRPTRRAPMSPDNPRFCEYCKEVNFNDPYCKKCKRPLPTNKQYKDLERKKDPSQCETCKDDNGSCKPLNSKGEFRNGPRDKGSNQNNNHFKYCKKVCKPQGCNKNLDTKSEAKAESKSEPKKENKNLIEGKKRIALWNKEDRCEVITQKTITEWKEWITQAGLTEEALAPLFARYEKCENKKKFIDSLNKWSKASCDTLTQEKVDEFNKWKTDNKLDDSVMTPLLNAYKKCKKEKYIEEFKENLNKWAKSNCETIKTAPIEDFKKWREKYNLDEKLIEPLKKAIEKCDFIERKKAEGAAVRAERAAAKAAAAAGSDANQGENISNLMHDGTCEKSKDCPTDRPKCLNNQCMTNDAFVAAKKAEGAAKRAERAAERAAAAAASDANQGENISNLMHDGTCEKAKDCPPDRPKCLNNQCMTNDAFVAAKKAEGAAKRAERAAERAAAAAATPASSGQDIANLMHDGTCEKHNDCPADKPKCNNGTCMTQADFTEAKKAEGATVRAQRAADRAAAAEEAKNRDSIIPEDVRENIEYDYDKYAKSFSEFIAKLPDNNKLKVYSNS